MATTGFTRLGSPNESGAEASQSGRRREITFRLRIGLPFIYARRLTRILVLAAVLADICIAFRVWFQVRGVVPDGPVSKLVYSLSAGLVEPFRKFDTGPSIKDTAILDFSALVAFDFFFAAALFLLASGWLLALLTRLVERWAPVVRLDLLRLQAAFVAYWRSGRTNLSNADGALSDLLDRGIAYVWTRDWAGYKAWIVRRWRSLQAGWSKTDRALEVLADTIVLWLRTRDWAGYKARIVRRWRSLQAAWSQADRALGRGADAVVHWLRTRDWAGYVAAVVRTYQKTLETLVAFYRCCAYWAAVAWRDSLRIAAEIRLLAMMGAAGLRMDVEGLPAVFLRELEASRLRLRQETDWWAVRATFARRIGLKSALGQRAGPEPAFTHLSRRDFFRRIARVFGPTV